MDGATQMGCDGGGAPAEVERVAIVVFEHSEQAGIAGQPPSRLAPEHDSGGLEAVLGGW